MRELFIGRATRFTRRRAASQSHHDDEDRSFPVPVCQRTSSGARLGGRWRSSEFFVFRIRHFNLGIGPLPAHDMPCGRRLLQGASYIATCLQRVVSGHCTSSDRQFRQGRVWATLSKPYELISSASKQSPAEERPVQTTTSLLSRCTTTSKYFPPVTGCADAWS